MEINKSRIILMATLTMYRTMGSWDLPFGGYGKTNTPFLDIKSTMQLDLFVNIAIKCNQIICFCVMLVSTYF